MFRFFLSFLLIITCQQIVYAQTRYTWHRFDTPLTKRMCKRENKYLSIEVNLPKWVIDKYDKLPLLFDAYDFEDRDEPFLKVNDKFWGTYTFFGSNRNEDSSSERANLNTKYLRPGVNRLVFDSRKRAQRFYCVQNLRFDIPNADLAAHGKSLLTVTSEPDTAIVYNGDDFWGHTPLNKSLKKGNYKLTLRKKGYKTLSKTVTVNSARKTIGFDLKKIKKKTEPKPKDQPVTAPLTKTELPELGPPKVLPSEDIAVPNAAPKNDRYFGVVIGIGDYKDNRIPKLNYTTADAEGIYQTLTSQHYTNIPKEQVKLLLDGDATYHSVKSAIGTWLRRSAGENDTVIVFFAGHGALEEEKAYWVTYNTDIDDLYGTAISNDEIADMFDRIASRRLIVFLDSCYSKATINRTAKGRSLVAVKDPFQKFRGKGRVIVTSSDGKQESLELDQFKHGLFSHFLLDALRGNGDTNKDGIILLDEVWDHVKHNVPETARRYGAMQTPMINGSFSAGIPLSRNLKTLQEIEQRSKLDQQKLETERKITVLRKLYLEQKLSSDQLVRAIEIIKKGEKNRLIDDLINSRIPAETFSTVF